MFMPMIPPIIDFFKGDGLSTKPLVNNDVFCLTARGQLTYATLWSNDHAIDDAGRRARKIALSTSPKELLLSGSLQYFPAPRNCCG